MSADWTNVSNSVSELLDLIDDFNGRERYKSVPARSRFALHQMSVTPDKDNVGRLKVAAFDDKGKAFHYAIYVDGFHTETDGY